MLPYLLDSCRASRRAKGAPEVERRQIALGALQNHLLAAVAELSFVW